MTTGPTEEFVKSVLDLSQVFLDDSIAMLEQGRFRSSVDRAYYSIHYGAVALLTHQSIRPPGSHRGLVTLFGREIVNRGVMGKEFSDMLSAALRDRSLSTYSPEAEVTVDDAREVVANAKRFYATARSILNH